MEQFVRDWSYLGVFLGIVGTGLGVPMPEELPVVIGGALVGGGQASFWMLPVCIVGVIVGDSFLYVIGRVWGTRLIEKPFVKKFLSAERLESIRGNFDNYGIRILLIARMTPGIRAPIFLTAGIMRLSLTQFLIADGIYAIPGVSLLFFLGYYFTGSMVSLIKNEAEMVKEIVILVVLVAGTAYFVYRFLRKPMVTGDPKEMPPVVEPFKRTYEKVASKIMHPLPHLEDGEPSAGDAPVPSTNGEERPADVGQPEPEPQPEKRE